LARSPLVTVGLDDAWLSEEDESILRALADQPFRLHTQDQIETASKVSRRTISSRLPRLLECALVDQPDGLKSGTRITLRGLALLRRIDSANRAR
jgi:RIO-like serine/threonine protein kinase